MTTVLTGAAGFLGQALVAALGDVVAIHRPGTPRPAPESVELDLGAPFDRAQLPAQVDSVLHVAQSRQYRDFPGGAVDVMEVNTAATVRLLDYAVAAGARSFVYASSGAAGVEPRNFYGASKLMGELAAEQYAGLLAVTSLRYFFIYGPGQEGMMMPGLIGRVGAGQPVTLAGEEGIRINPVYVDDAAAATIAAAGLAESSGVIDVAGPETVSIKDIAETIGRELGTEPQFEHGPAAPDLVADTARMATRLAAPAVPPAEGLRRTIAARQTG